MKKTIFAIHFFIFSAAILLILPFSVKAQEPDWLVRLKQQKWMSKISKLKLLQTTRAEAEKILGAPESSTELFNYSSHNYAIGKGRVSLDYSTKECSSADGLIAKNTIEYISFVTESKISFSKLRIPIKQFRHEQTDTLADVYVSDQSGIEFYVQSNRLLEISFTIPDEKDTNCVTAASFLADFNKAKSLKLIESNREEVRKAFPDYFKAKDSGYNDTYDSGDARFEFYYSTGKCPYINSDRYDTAEWTVESIKIQPINDIKPDEFGIDLTKYKKEQMYSNLPDLYAYYDKDAGISFQVSQGKIKEINLLPPPKYNWLMCDKEQAKMLASNGSLFADKLEDRVYSSGTVAYTEKLYLSQSEITAACDSTGKNCSDGKQSIDVYTLGKDAENDVLTYNYTVSAGKIIGQGSKVVWDLTGVKAGTYTISAAVDDGCGFCGADKTKTVVIKGCPDCR